MSERDGNQVGGKDVPRRDYRPVGAGKGTGPFATLKRTVTEFSEDNLTVWGAALTYYGLRRLGASAPVRYPRLGMWCIDLAAV